MQTAAKSHPFLAVLAAHLPLTMGQTGDVGPRSGWPSADGARIVIADGDRLFATTLTAALERHEEFEVVGIAGDGAEAVALAEDLKPSVVVMDADVPVLDGIEAT